MLYFVAMWLVVTLPVSLVLGITAAVSYARGPQRGQALGVVSLGIVIAFVAVWTILSGGTLGAL